MSDLMLKIVGAVLVALPIVAFFVWAYREMGRKGFFELVRGMVIGFAFWGSIIIGIGLLNK